jgi:hypothetical protein
LAAFALLAAAPPRPPLRNPSGGRGFAGEVAPLLKARCLRCHSGARPKGDLDLTSRARLVAGASPVVAPGAAERSPLFVKVRDGHMPPGKPLGPAEVALLRRWIDAGAPWEGPPLAGPAQKAGRAGPDWWSLRPVRRPPPPLAEGARTAVDGFLLARLAAAGLTFSPEADRRTYLQRVTLDLTGLRPTPAELDAFLADRSPDAYEKVVDRLLASPAYGERWGRHWLDVVRFGESSGYEVNNPRPNAWPYRDYVIRAFNRDTPYPEFIRDQLAGEEADDPLTACATGFLVAGPHDLVGIANLEGQLQQRQDDLADMVATTGATFLGLSVGCARCHDHKFDPITQKDYYGLQAVFAGVVHAERPLRAPAPPLVPGELAPRELAADLAEPPAGPPGGAATRPGVRVRRNVERFKPVVARHVRLTVSRTLDGSQPCLDELEVYGPDRPGRNLALAAAGATAAASSLLPGYKIHQVAHLNDGRYGNGRSWISAEAGRGWGQVSLPRAAAVDRVVWGRDREGRYRDRLAAEYKVEVSADGKEWQAVAGSWDRRPPGTGGSAAGGGDLLPRQAYAGTFRTPDPTHLLRRGDPLQKGEVVAPSAVRAVGRPLALSGAAPEAGRRRALAGWLADPANPLPARVMVNRVWHYHFGQGLVRTPSDFGYNGDRPSHPELLDWLAAEYQAGGWRLKPLHRLIVLSAAYRQGGRADPRAAADAGNRLLWRVPPRRLDAEVIRDTMLQVSGTLDRAAGGPGYRLWETSNYVTVYAPKRTLGPETFRRMVYQFKPRLQQDGTFGAFDCPDATASVPRRNVSTTALQALNLLNDPFVHAQAAAFAGRVRREAGAGVEAQVGHAFRLAFGRQPRPVERQAAVRLARSEGLAAVCHALFNANEFVFY